MIKIYGAGMAGLLSAHVLRRHSPIVHEAQSDLPHNHAALLRFRSNKISDATGIPFRAVKVQKAVDWDYAIYDRASMAMTNAYSFKVTGRVMGRSILDLRPVTRYIAPGDFIERLADGVDIKYNSPLTEAEECISTIPMPTLMGIVSPGVPAPPFEAKQIWTIAFDIISPEVDVYQTVYVASPEDEMYRASITGSRVILEFVSKPKDEVDFFEKVSDYFGIHIKKSTQPYLSSQKFGKLIPIDDDVRRAFILHATDVHRIYSVGRFATWRQILLDDVVDDLKVVDRMLSQRNRYSLLQALHQ